MKEWGRELVCKEKNMYSQTCLQRPLVGESKHGHLTQVVF